jgi:hypothetical protein
MGRFDAAGSASFAKKPISRLLKYNYKPFHHGKVKRAFIGKPTKFSFCAQTFVTAA